MKLPKRSHYQPFQQASRSPDALGGIMKRFLRFTPLLLFVLLGSAFANSIRIGLLPNDGSGDNFGFFQQSGGVTVFVGGGTPFDFFNVFGYVPGTTLGGSTDVFFGGGVIRIDGTWYDISFDAPGALFMSSFTLPNNGKDFTAHVGLDFSASGSIFNPDQTFISVGGGAKGTIKFSLVDGVYYPGSFVQAPEPGALVLVGTGLIGILGIYRRRFGL